MASSVLFGKMDNHRDPLQQGTQEMVGNKNAAAVLILLQQQKCYKYRSLRSKKAAKKLNKLQLLMR